jgi:hypothetical protein
MNANKVAEFIKASWLPKRYRVEEISLLFDIPYEEARRIVKMISAGDNTALVAHHDLKEFLQDSGLIPVLSRSTTPLTDAGKWLCDQGWQLNLHYKKYRFIDPKEPVCRYTLRGAVNIQFQRLDKEAEIIDVEFAIVADS